MQPEMHFTVYCHLGHYSLDKLSFMFLLLSFTQYVSFITLVTKEEMCERCVALRPETRARNGGKMFTLVVADLSMHLQSDDGFLC